MLILSILWLMSSETFIVTHYEGQALQSYAHVTGTSNNFHKYSKLHHSIIISTWVIQIFVSISVCDFFDFLTQEHKQHHVRIWGLSQQNQDDQTFINRIITGGAVVSTATTDTSNISHQTWVLAVEDWSTKDRQEGNQEHASGKQPELVWWQLGSPTSQHHSTPTAHLLPSTTQSLFPTYLLIEFGSLPKLQFHDEIRNV